MAVFGFSAMIPARLCFLPKRRAGHQGSLCSASLAHISPTLLSTSSSLGAICSCILYNDEHFTSGAKAHQKMKQTEERDGGAEGRALHKKTWAHAMDDSRGCFCMKDCFSLSLSHSFFVSISLSLSFLLAVWRANDALLASSQEVKLNCRARLPNDERLWRPGML